MGTMLNAWIAAAPWPRIVGLVLDVPVKAAGVVIAAWLVTLALRRSSAHARSAVWIFTLAMLVALPFTQLATPLWKVPVESVIKVFLEPSGAASVVVPPVGGSLESREADAAVAVGGPRASTAPSPGGAPGWLGWVFLAWAFGMIISLLWLVAGSALGRRILGRCAAADAEWSDLLADVGTRLGCDRRVRVFESNEINAAVTVGAINPAIVVPAGSSSWPLERRRCILAHELAHIMRRDGLGEVLVRVAGSIHWFNPLAWAAIRSLRVERERDCDDAVLRVGAKPSEYAMFLMDIASALHARREPAWQLSTISQGSNLKERIMCILDPKIDRNRSGRRAGIVSCLLVASIVVPLSLAGMWEVQAQDKCDKKKAEEKACKDKQAAELKAMQGKKVSKDIGMSEVELKKAMENMTPEERDKFMKEIELKKETAKLSKEEKIKIGWDKISENEDSGATLAYRAISKMGPEAGIEALQKMKQEKGDSYYFKEAEFNTLGYYYLFGGKLDEALAVFKYNVVQFPDAWNVYDSYGEAMLVAGKYEKARGLYEKSLALNPENENGKMMLAKIADIEKNGESVAAK